MYAPATVVDEIEGEVRGRLLKVVSEHRSSVIDEQLKVLDFGARISKAGITIGDLDRRTRGDHITAQAIVRAFESERERTPGLTLTITTAIVLGSIHGPVTGSHIAKSREFKEILAIYRH